MPKEQSPGKPTTRRYSTEEKAAAVRMVRTLRAELGTEQGTVQRVARQLGYGVESVRTWVRQADIDEGLAPGVSTSESKKVQELEQEIRELKRANEILKRAASFFGAELDRQDRTWLRSSMPTVKTWSRAGVWGSSASAQFCRWPRAVTTRAESGNHRHGPSATRRWVRSFAGVVGR